MFDFLKEKVDMEAVHKGLIEHMKENADGNAAMHITKEGDDLKLDISGSSGQICFLLIHFAAQEPEFENMLRQAVSMIDYHKTVVALSDIAQKNAQS